MAGRGKKCVVKRKSSSKKGARRQPVSKMKTAKKRLKPGGARGKY